MNYWLFKSEPDTFGIDHLKALPQQTDSWDGVRNYQARNLMRDEMRVGDLGFFYHSNCKTPGIVAVVEVVREAYPDHTAQDPESNYYDPKASADDPRWFMVDVKFKHDLPRLVSLRELKACDNAALADFKLLTRGNRLSVLPVPDATWTFINDWAKS